MENNYKALKPLKVQSSLSGVKIPIIQKFYKEGFDKTNIINGIDDIDWGDDYSDNIDDEDSHDISNTEANTGKSISNSDKNNIHVNNRYMCNLINKKIKKKESITKLSKSCASARANSK